MSGTKIKTNRGNATKSKNIGSPIVIKKNKLDFTDGKYSLIEKFLTSTSAEDQLGNLKIILEQFKESNDERVALFLAVVFYEAPAKHPIKCFLTRHVTKCPTISNSFTSSLTAYIDSEIRNNYNSNDLNFYKGNVPKIMMCTENFPPGAKAVGNLDVKFLVQRLFVDYFVYPRNDIIYRNNSSLSPTEKNNQFSLEHTMLRLMVHVLQNIIVDESTYRYRQCFANITECVKVLVFDEEVPMDTKSLAGILALHAESMMKTNWQYTCVFIMSGYGTFPGTCALMSAPLGRLVLLCALAAVAPLSAFTPSCLDEEHPMLTLVDQLLPFADGAAGSGDVTVCVARALVALAGRALTEPAKPAGPDAPAGPAEPAPGALTARLLTFVWAHLEHPLDAVRHLARTLLAHCLQYAATLEKRGADKNANEDSPLGALLSSVRALGPCRSVYWTVAAACGVVGGARVLRELATAPELVRAAGEPHLQAAASAAIAAVLGSGACAALPPAAVFDTWVRDALASPAALQAVLPPATAACPHLPAYISSMLRGRALLQCARAAPSCCAPLAPRTLRAHAIHQDDESRLVVVALVCERGRGTEVAPREDLATVLWALQYNMASPRPAFRTALLHLLNKLVKRLEASSRALEKRGRGAECAHYPAFLRRAQLAAAAAAGPGAAPARRATALQLLATLAPHLHGEWAAEDVATLLAALEDSYDGNKELALRALAHCPTDLLERHCPLRLADVVRGARSARAVHSAAAAARLRLLLDLLPHTLAHTHTPPPGVSFENISIEERAHYSAGLALHAALCAAAAGDLRAEAARGGAHGTLRCVRALLQRAPHRSASWNRCLWVPLYTRLLEAAQYACKRAEPAVCSQAPEGFLPPCFPGELEEEEAQVTAQMVLVCAWRTIKEGAGVISLLCPLVSRGECVLAGDYLVGLLVRARHRGAVDQAAEGLAALAQQCWVDADRSALPRCWLAELLRLVCGAAPHATRRGAGLTAAIQALVSSEVTATGRTDCFEDCMKQLLHIAAAPDIPNATTDTRNGATETQNGASNSNNENLNTEDSSSSLPEGVARRTLAANILRALFRHSALDRASQPFVSDGLKLALNGFEAAAWPERTAMSLLFCALCVRVFGVSRARGALHARNTLPAHVLAARYPGIYDTMMSKLVECGWEVRRGPAVLPVLLLLARVYPTPATPHTLQICRFVPLVQRCACAADMRVRRLAARALPAILTPDQYLPYIEKLLTAVCNPNLQRNHWHGALLTLSSLIERASSSNNPIGVTLNGANDTLPGNGTLKGWYSTRDEINRQQRPDSYYGSPKTVTGSSNVQEELANTSTISTINMTKQFDQSNKSKDETNAGAKLNDAERSNNLEKSNTTKKSIETLKGYPKGSMVLDSLCALVQATGERPCYVIAREYCSVLNLLVWKFPSMVGESTVEEAKRYLDIILFHGKTEFGPDRELCLADCLLLYLVLLQRMGRVHEIIPLIVRSLSHATCEVYVAACDFLLIQLDQLEYPEPCLIRQHLTAISNISILQALRASTQYQTYLNTLTNITHDTKQYQECRFKSLRLLTLENDTQLLVISEKLPEILYYENHEQKWVVKHLIQHIQEDNLTKHMYLESLLQYIKGKMEHLGYFQANNILGILYDCSSSQNAVECRFALISYFESDLADIIELTWESQSTRSMFAYKALIYSTLVTLLEDDDDDIRQRASDVTTRLTCPRTAEGYHVALNEHECVADPYDVTSSLPLLKQAVYDISCGDVTPAASGALLRARLQAERDGCALLLLLALLDFRAEVRLTDVPDESRVFEQSERYNTLLDESAWTASCADTLIQMCATPRHTELLQHALAIVHDETYYDTFQSLCQGNLNVFEKMANGEPVAKDDTLNPKIEVLLGKLRR